MKEGIRFFHRGGALALLLACVSVALAQQPTPESVRTDRLVAVAKLWAAVKFFHPYLGYRDKIDWDGALVRAIPKVNASRNVKEFSAAVQGMLSELGDPATRVLDKETQEQAAPNLLPPKEKQPTFRTNSDGILVVSMTSYSDFVDSNGTEEMLGAIKKEISKARAVVFDLRPTVTPSELEQGMASYGLSQSGIAEALTSSTLEMPSERRRMHIGYAPQNGAASGDYSSGFYLQGRQSIMPGAGAKEIPVVFLMGPHSDVPDFALGLQAAGKGAIVAEGALDEGALVSTQAVELPDGVRAQIRLGELVYRDGTSGFAPNVNVPVSNTTGDQNAAWQAALGLARTGKFTTASREPLVEGVAAPRDNPYSEMRYPAVEYRLLAAFRLWAVIDYFFPYKDFMGEDWNDVLRQFIPRMEQSKDALEYNLAVVEMVTHIHDSHGFVHSAVLRKYFGEASIPARVRMVEGVPVITAFTDVEAAKAAGLEVGDVILKVDGVDATSLIADRLKYTAHSTPQSGMYFAVERALTRGPKDSTATLTVRDLHENVRQLKMPRKEEYLGRTTGDRSGDILRVLPGNIGYADLDRLPAEQVDEMFEKFKDCPAIIFDDRGYPHGTGWQIAPRLTDKTNVEAAMFKRRDALSPDLPNGDIAESHALETFKQLLPRTVKWRYYGKTVMLVDERTLSHAEHTGLFLEAANGTKFIGSPTQGANGDATNLSLPGGIFVYFSGQGVWHADGRQLQRMGLQPDVVVRPTIAGIRARKDEVLDRAVEYVEESLRNH